MNIFINYKQYSKNYMLKSLQLFLLKYDKYDKRADIIEVGEENFYNFKK